MKMKLSFQIAVRFLKSNPWQTVFIALGIGIGVSVQIFIGSLITGLQKSLVETTIGSSSQITVTADSEGNRISDYEALLATLGAADSRIEYVGPTLDSAAFLQSGDRSQSLLVRGLREDSADSIYSLKEAITEGAFPTGAFPAGAFPTGEYQVLLGEPLRDEYGLSVGDSFDLITADKRTIPVIVSGFFDLKVASLNENWCITSLENAQAIFQTGDVITSVEMQLYESDVFAADQVADKLGSLLGTGYAVTNWKAENESLLSGLQGQSTSSLMIQVFVMVSVVLGIASVLAITVMQKSRQIGILKAMGIRDGTASLIFLSEGLLLGVLGAAAGIGLGLGLTATFTAFALTPDGTPIVPLYLDGGFIALSGCIAVAACLLASLIPARRSSRLSPIDIIRNN